ncbi:Uncharacterised protein [uncultured archaeon]|nr:Uncharacterised protein [uncultured archaeon]
MNKKKIHETIVKPFIKTKKQLVAGGTKDYESAQFNSQSTKYVQYAKKKKKLLIEVYEIKD